MTKRKGGCTYSVTRDQPEPKKQATDISLSFDPSKGLLTRSHIPVVDPLLTTSINQSDNSQTQASDHDLRNSTFTDTNPSIPSTTTNPGKACPQGASTIMDTFKIRLEEIQQHILRLEYHSNVDMPCCCDRGQQALYRCRDCFLSTPQCEDCIVEAHQHNPFHHIEKWNSKNFERTALTNLGMKLYLGHESRPCPNLRKPGGRPLILLHTNGFHEFAVVFCGCHPRIPEEVQLLQSSLFPATLQRPETALSFSLLNEMQLHTVVAKTSVHDYHNVLRRLSKPTAPDTLLERARECSRLVRIWRHLTVVRRSGQAHGVDEYLPHRRPQSLTIRCPACPEVSFNIEAAFLAKVSKTKPEECHKYTKFLSGDGNFRLQQKKKVKDPDDVALNEGNAYFVESEKYEAYLEKAEKQSSSQSTCSHLRAARLQNIAKFKNATVSGVISIQCARHGFYQPQGTADLVKGETYARTDYVLIHALAEDIHQKWISFMYDIWCHFMVELLRRTARHFHSMVPIIELVRGAVPKMHIKNHVDSCQARWTPNYLRYNGETCGELIETGWAENNQVAGATKEMNSGHRHDTVDDHFNWWNWNKSLDLVPSITQRYRDTSRDFGNREEKFNDLCGNYDEVVLERWRKLGEDATEVDGVWTSPFVPHFKDGGPPTQAKAYEAVVDNMKVAQWSGRGCLADARYIQDGILIEQEQFRIRALAKSTKVKPKNLDGAREALRKRLKEWVDTQLSMFPGLRNDVPNPSETEHTLLCLPSSYPEHERIALKMEHLATIEFVLREGQCHDTLQKLKLAIQVFNHNLAVKTANVHGQNPNTRAQAFMKTLTSDKVNATDTYNHARQALLSLGLAEDDQALQPLLETDLWGKNLSKHIGLGESHLSEPWFWYTGRPTGLTKDEAIIWDQELDRVRWFRERAALERCREEVEILEEEMFRVYVSYTRWIHIWTSIALKETNNRGASCYAYKQAAMYAMFQADTLKSIEHWFPVDFGRRVRGFSLD